MKLPKKIKALKLDNARRSWYRFSRSPLSLVGLVISVSSILVAVFAPYITPHPEDAGLHMHFDQQLLSPSLQHLFGTDEMGRDVFTRTIFGFQYSFAMVAVVLTLVVPSGVSLGLIAGYHMGSKIDVVLMRIADIFIAVPPLILALAICSVLTPSIFNAMVAVALMWWPWYARLTYSTASAVRNEYFVKSAEVVGAGKFNIMFKEILPNCIGPILTKVTLDVGWVILLGAALSFVGLGAQPPTPDLGTMVASGGRFLPESWWISIFPAAAVSFIIFGFNLLGDGIRDMFVEETR